MVGRARRRGHQRGAQLNVVLVAAVPERCVRGGQGYAKTDATFLNWARKRRRRDGSTAVTALLLGSKIFFGWAGDSRGFVLDAAWQVSWVSSDHKPNRPDEMERIKKAGGACLNLCVSPPPAPDLCNANVSFLSARANVFRAPACLGAMFAQRV